MALLLEVHPNLRATAATSTSPIRGPFARDDQRRPALSKLAFEIQRRGEDAGISRADARKIIADYLSNESGSAWAPLVAREGAQILTDVNSETSGLLLERGPDELAFCHAAFREHLAGLELATWSFEDQIEFAKANSHDPRWRGAILALLQSTPRPLEVQKLLTEVRKSNPIGAANTNRTILLADAVFALTTATGQIGREIVASTLDRVEDGPRDEERAELLGLVLDGPREGPIGDAIVTRMSRWWPCVTAWRAEVYGAIQNWPESDEVLRALWRGLHDDEMTNRLGAARALAIAAAGSNAVFDSLGSLVRTSESPNVVAAALEAMCAGWPDGASIEEFLTTALGSTAHSIRGVAALALFRRGSRATDVKSALVEMIEERQPWVARAFVGQVIEALATGWADDKGLRDLCWESVDRGAQSRPLDHDAASALLLKCFRRDPAVGSWVAATFRDNQRFGLLLHDFADLVIPIVEAVPEVRDAVDSWLSDVKARRFDHNASRLAGAMKSPNAKRYLLTELNRRDGFAFHEIAALISGWGMQDTEVSSVLWNAAMAPPDKRQVVAQDIPRIVSEPAQATRLLLEIAELPKVDNPGSLIRGLAQVKPLPNEEAVVTAILPHIVGRDGYFSGLAEIIATFPRDPRVRGLAMQSMMSRHAPLATIAQSYRDDAEVRRAIFDRASPLPARFRRLIASRASQRFEDSVLRRTVDLFDSEVDSGAKVQAAIGYARAVIADGQNVESVVGELSKQLHAVGPDHEERRVAAFSALLTMGRVDVVAAAIQPYDGKPVNVGLFNTLHDTEPALQVVAERWSRLEDAFGADLANRLNRWSDDGSVDWDALSPYASRNSRLAGRFFDYCADPSSRVSGASLENLARLRPSSSLLFETCKRALLAPAHGTQVNPFELQKARLTASKLLGHNFRDKPESRELLLAAATQDRNFVGLIGLTVAWPNQPEVARACEDLRAACRPIFGWPLSVAIVGAIGDTELFRQVACSFMARVGTSIWDFSALTLDALRARVERDVSTHDDLLAAGERSDHPSILLSAARLLPGRGAVSPEAVSRLRNVARREAERHGTPRFGLDITVNRTKSLPITLGQVEAAFA